MSREDLTEHLRKYLATKHEKEYQEKKSCDDLLKEYDGRPIFTEEELKEL